MCSLEIESGRREQERERRATGSRARPSRQKARGRALPEEPRPPIAPPSSGIRDRILHSKAFRRLKHKTQVFINPEGDHVVTRLTHTLAGGADRAVLLAVVLGLNEAPRGGHLSGLTNSGIRPFGHIGEEALSPYVDGGVAPLRAECAVCWRSWSPSM